jgi:hypothetical protein
MVPETHAQPQDGRHISSPDTGRARLQDGQGTKAELESPLVKFARVWASEK